MRYTAEPRETEFYGERCVIDEHVGPCGMPIKMGLSQDEARRIAKKLNEVFDDQDHSTDVAAGSE